MREWPLTVSDAANLGTNAADALDGPGIAAIADGSLLRASARRVCHAAVDSRRVEPGMLFVALPGEHTDGHRFLADAVARGAAALLVTRDLADAELDALAAAAPGGCSIVRVRDGIGALHALAAAWRLRFDPLVVGITGSIAKTSTKEAVATVLSRSLPSAAIGGQREQRDRPTAHAPAPRARIPGRGPRDGHVRAGRDRSAVRRCTSRPSGS